MPVQIRSNQITGITEVINSTDVANKAYVDKNVIPSFVGNETKFLYTDGSTPTFQFLGNYVEYKSFGNYTFNVPINSKQLCVELMGGGGAGAAATTEISSYVNQAAFWFLRTSGTSLLLGGNGVGNPSGIYANNIYSFIGQSGIVISSTDSITWRLRTTGTTVQMCGINYVNNNYIAHGNNGVLVSSTDNITWILRTNGSASSVNNLIYTSSILNNLYIISNANNQIITSTDSISWTIRTNPGTFTPYASTRNGVVGREIIFVGSSAGIVSSTDSITWILRTSGVLNSGTNAFYSTEYANGIYLIGSSGGRLGGSTDAITWVLRTSPTGTNDIYSIVYSNNLYVATLASNRVMVSTDTIVWILRTTLATGSIYGGIYGNGIYLVSSSNGNISSSPLPQGIAGSGGGSGAYGSWIIPKSFINSSTLTINVGSGGTLGNPGTATTISWNGLGGNCSVSVSGGFAGTNTYDATSGTIPGGSGGQILQGSSNYLLSSPGVSGGNGGLFESSPFFQGLSPTTNLLTASYQSSGGGGGASSYNRWGSSGSIAAPINYYSNTYYDNNDLMTSNNAYLISGLSYGKGGNGGGAQYGPVVWRIRTSGLGNPVSSFYASAYGNGIYLLGGSNSRFATSTDTIVWVTRTCPSISSIYGITYGNNVYVLCGDSGIICSSTDAISWELRTSSSTSSLGNYNASGGPGLIYANGVYVSSGQVRLTSTNSIVWTLRTSLASYSINYGNTPGSTYISTGVSAASVFTSTDTIVWVLRTSGANPTTNVATSCEYDGNNYFIVCSNSLTVHTSTNAIFWTNIRTLETNPYSINYGNGEYVITGSSGFTWSSVDGITWILRTSFSNGNNINTTTYGNGLFLTGSNNLYISVADSNTVGNGANGVRGGGGGGGGFESITKQVGTGGNGGDGYVRISWQ